MKISFTFNLDNILYSTFGKFGLAYYMEQKTKKKKNTLNKNDKFIDYIYHLVGKIAVIYLKICTRIYYYLLNHKEKEEFLKNLNIK